MNKKELIRLSATKIIARDGFHKTKIQSIATEANIAVGTVYIYFKSKEGILDYIFETQHKKVEEFIKRLEGDDITPLEKISKILRFHLKGLGEDPNLAMIMARETRGPPRNGSSWSKDGSGDIPGVFRNMLNDSKLIGEIRDINTELFGAIIFFIGVETAYLLQLQGKIDNNHIEFDELLTFIVKGIEKKTIYS